MLSCNGANMHISKGAIKQKLDHTVDVLLGILDVISQEVRQIVIQVLQQLHCITNEEDRVVFAEQDPLVAVQSQGLISQKGGHSSPEGTLSSCDCDNRHVTVMITIITIMIITIININNNTFQLMMS